MPRKTEGRRLFAEAHLAQRLKIERERRGWSYAGLAKRTKDLGCEIAASALWKIENPTDPSKPRRIAVEELVVLSQVFEVPMAEFVADPEAQLPARAAELAERAMAAYARIVQLVHESNEAVREVADLMMELRKTLEDRPQITAQIASDIQSEHPDWEWSAGAGEADSAFASDTQFSYLLQALGVIRDGVTDDRLPAFMVMSALQDLQREDQS